MMKRLTINELRSGLSTAITSAEAGETTVITRNGEPVAVLAPIDQVRPPFPDMSAFRASIKSRGPSLTATLLQMRQEERG